MEDVDVFANIDIFLNGDPALPSSPCMLAPLPPKPLRQDLSQLCSPDTPQRSKKSSKRKTANKKLAPDLLLDLDDDDLNSSGSSENTKLMPGKGQKGAVEKFERIKASLQRHTRLTAPLESPSSNRSADPTTVSCAQSIDSNASTTTTRGRAARRRNPRIAAATAASRMGNSSNNDPIVIDLSGDIANLGPQVPLFSSENRSVQRPHGTSVDDVFADENYTLQVNVKWCVAGIEKFPLRRYHPFAELCQTLSERYDCNADHIVLSMGDQIVQQQDTPDSVGYTIGKIITARPLQSNIGSTSRSKSGPSCNASGTAIELKIQSSLWKRPILMSMEPTKKMMVLVILCAQRLNCEPERLRLRFDGEALDLHATADELELEGGEVIDLWMTSDE